MRRPIIIPDFDCDGLQESKDMDITSDVLGSYTGRAAFPEEQPVQDADDL